MTTKLTFENFFQMKFDTSTDLGRRFKEAWLDRFVLDKRAIRADMALRHKK